MAENLGNKRNTKFMIFHDLRLIFIHLPRTGGSIVSHSLAGSNKKTIEDLHNQNKTKKGMRPSEFQIELLEGEKNPHYPFSFWEDKYPKESQAYLKVGMVRNPFDWLPSLYYYFFQEKNMDFGKFVRAVAKDTTLEQAHNDYCELSCFFSEALKDFHYVIKFENLKENLKSFYTDTNLFNEDEIVERLQVINSPLPNWKTRKRKRDYRKYYTPKLIKFVEKHWAEDLKKYNYSFNK